MRCVFIIFFSAICLIAKSQNHPFRSIASLFNNTESIKGKSQNLNTPYNTAGDKLYMVGNQDGTFPDIGWHIKGEMGGLWQHPIKLLDGFEVSFLLDNKSYDLNHADAFVNFPFGNKHIYNTFSDKISIERFQFVPDEIGAVYIEFCLKNTSTQTVHIEFDVKVISNLRPVWLGERTGMIDGKDSSAYDKKNNNWVTKDAINPWYVIYGSTLPGKAINSFESKADKPNTTITHTIYSIEIKPNAVFSLPLTVAGSSKSKEEATVSYNQVSQNAFALISKKKERILKLNDRSKITLNDKELATAFRWLKYNCDWLTLSVDGIGKGMVGGLPDYPWWFGGDIVNSLRGLIGTGRKDVVYSTIDLINNVSEKTNKNGRIIHEVSTNGAVYNLGNVNETPQFVSLIWDIYCWTGDINFLKKYFPIIQKGLTWLMKENDPDGNLIPDGNGMMEIHGLNLEMIDVAVYSQKAFADAAQIAKILGKEGLSKVYEKKAGIMKTKINTDFWVPEFNSYADFIATKAQALKLVDEAIVRADTLKNSWAVAELKDTRTRIEKTANSNAKKGFVMYHNWVVNTPMETGVADKEKAVIALNTATRFTNPYGMFVTGIDRDESAGKDESSYAASANKKDFTYTGTVMTLPTGVQIVGENNYGRPDEAYKLLKKVCKTFSYALPGSIYEVSPDYGMMTQAWNMYAVGAPIIEQFFGIKPLAYKKEISLSPLLPSGLTKGKIQNVIIGNNELTLSFSQKDSSTHFSIKQTSDAWTIIFSQPKGKYTKWILNNKLVNPTVNGESDEIRIHGRLNNLELVD